MLSVALGVLLCATTLGSMDEPHPVTTTLVSPGAHEKIGYFQALGVELTDTKPDLIKKEPADLKAPKYGVFRFGHFHWLGGPGGEPAKPTTTTEQAPAFAAILDEPDGGPKRLFVDTNRDGDLTNDPAPEWKETAEPGGDGTELKTYSGTAAFNFGTDKEPRLLHMAVYRFDKNDQRRAAGAKYLVCFRDYMLTADLPIGDKTIKAMITDEMATGDFRGVKPAPAADAEKKADPGAEKKDADAPAPPADDQEKDPTEALFASGTLLILDVNGNGQIDSRGEVFNAREPFNIGGTTYEIADMTADGKSFKLNKSSKSVAEVKPPPDLSAGQKIPAFEATLLDGKKVKFPDDYKGKIVMLDFWATWCGPCMREVPHVVAAYDKFHAQGFDVLGVSLDEKDALDKLKSVTADKKMAWPQIFDGKGWRGSLVELYAVEGIPACWLVDGDTGLIIADESKLRGEGQPSATIEQALADKKAKAGH